MVADLGLDALRDRQSECRPGTPHDGPCGVPKFCVEPGAYAFEAGLAQAVRHDQLAAVIGLRGSQQGHEVTVEDIAARLLAGLREGRVQDCNCGAEEQQQQHAD
jgi:hypothetical protein